MDEVTTRFRVWLVPGKEPSWDGVAIVQADVFTTDTWNVVVQGDGCDFERFLKSRRDLFTLYERQRPR